ncbi:hypothetical protein RB213_007026 [Colletotrichum asianum]
MSRESGLDLQRSWAAGKSGSWSADVAAAFQWNAAGGKTCGEQPDTTSRTQEAVSQIEATCFQPQATDVVRRRRTS